MIKRVLTTALLGGALFLLPSAVQADEGNCSACSGHGKAQASQSEPRPGDPAPPGYEEQPRQDQGKPAEGYEDKPGPDADPQAPGYQEEPGTGPDTPTYDEKPGQGGGPTTPTYEDKPGPTPDRTTPTSEDKPRDPGK